MPTDTITDTIDYLERAEIRATAHMDTDLTDIIAQLATLKSADPEQCASLIEHAERLAAAHKAGETLDARLIRLDLSPGESRRTSLELAHPLVDDDTLRALASALRLSRKDTITLPANHLEGLSRGRGWARKGRRDSAEWGERVDNGYRVGPGRWVVGGTDGFRRKRSDTWDVQHVQVGDSVWTIAD